MLPIAFTLIFLALLAIAMATDLHSMIIPDSLNIALAILAVPALLLAGASLPTLGWHVLAGLIAFVISVILFYLGVFGGGDAKMIPGVMIWIGPVGAMTFLTGMALVGGALGIILLLARQLVPANGVLILQKTSGVPYAVAIAAGALLAAPFSPALVPLSAFGG